MQNVSRQIAIGFLAALVVALIAVAICVPHERAFLLTEVAPFVGLFGTVTVTYQYPVPGVAAQTPALAAAHGFHNGYNTVRGTIIADADGDTDAVISHGMDLSAGALAAGQPEIGYYVMTGAAAAGRLSMWAFANTDGDTVTATKTTTGSSGDALPQLAFAIRRPHSIAI